jgi:hypothetical protein
MQEYDSAEADTWNTLLSTDDSGGDDEVQSTPSLTPVEKPYPNMLFRYLGGYKDVLQQIC